ncbi:thioesterase superfamily protein [Colletotrichum graminicola]|uniref:Thioesterase superfamily protein n=1 Tax=Colletotrichum graminicola (strain M1.001 / M2 / FGSC 10212) TaxID=645133 RepID=E3Q9W5_COLGM|nr:thioesterase superfamily protein [Colletotrichum graminicola M1.001]EFQ27653.1 thioesterase superfamily protein [Colletotrichum graminicola M1.001]WDK11677.1 thioesterase superfamily protein [Colletotrichum graminicola]
MSGEIPAKFKPVFDAKTGEERIKAWLTLDKDDAGNFESGSWMSALSPSISLISASLTPTPSATFAFTVRPEHCNRAGNLHGGAAATLFDSLTTMPLALINDRPGYWQFLGVSRTLSCSYLRPAPAGEECIVECEIVQVGRLMCHLRGTLRRKRDGSVLATCEHHKFNTDPPASKL